jgi:signal transduction histidine kinase
MRYRLFITALMALGQVGYARTAAEDSLRHLLKIQVQAGPLQRAEWNTRLGGLYADVYLFDSATACFERALHLTESSGDEERIYKALSRLGYIHYMAYTYSRALEYYHRSLDLAADLHSDSLRAVSLDWISLQYLYSGAYSQAINYQLESISIREALRDSIGLCESYYSMGDILSHQRRLEESNTYFRRCAELARHFELNGLLMGAYGSIGQNWMQAQNWDSAFFYNRHSLQLAEANDSDYGKAFGNSSLGKCYLETGLLDSAAVRFERALVISRHMSEYNELAVSLLGLGRLAQKRQQMEEARRYLMEGLSVAQEFELNDLVQEGYTVLAETFHEAGMHDSAYAYLLALVALKDTLFEKRSASMVSSLEARYGILQSEAEQQALLLSKDAQIRNLSFAIAGVGILLTLGLLWLSIYKMRHQRRLNSVLEAHSRTVEEQNEKLVQVNEDLKQFAYAASHDLKQPLRTIGNFSSLIERRFQVYIDEDTADYFQYIQRAVRDMSSLLTNLLQYTQLENKADSYEELDMNDILATVTNNLIQLIQERNANVMAEYLPRVYANREHMVQLMQNLINNAIKFNDKPNPEVWVSYRRSGQGFCFSVRDNGIGIDAEYRDRIFGLFQRVGDREQFEGSGMGLAITRRIVRQYQGQIWVDSELEQGSVFHFELAVQGEEPVLA